ncbi:thiamine phosphate synthase [Bacillus sp. REN10]|uniref:thiamine phosphate synthase n=1 Tax=Bacillus sp. REN10 TaxID=2782541 RepID=UPI00193B2B96|nr:thiamine phosphate synthase [Bacillus sp. REN10]
MFFQLHAVTTGTLDQQQAANIASKIHPFVDYVHIREKHRSAKEILEWVESFIDVGVPAKKIIVNDRLDVALVSGVAGVQLTENSLPVVEAKKIEPALTVGCSVHDPEVASIYAEHGADFILFGHIYETSCKPSLAPVGLWAVKEASALSRVPIIAIGGILPHHVKELKQAGADGIAVMSGIFGHSNPLEQAIAYREAIKKEERMSQ